jgi:hypothetical protein
VRQVTLAAVLALGAALGSGPAQGGSDIKLNVSATILPRIACSVVSSAARCEGTGAAANYRVRRDGGVLSIEW